MPYNEKERRSNRDTQANRKWEIEHVNNAHRGYDPLRPVLLRPSPTEARPTLA